MTKHTVAIPLIVVSSISGLWIYLIIASAFKWINPIWWGGEEMLLPYLGSISVFVSDLLFYFIITCLLKNIIAQQGASLTKLVLIASIMGLVFLPFVEVVARVKNVFSFWANLNPFIAITLAFTMAGTFSVLTGIVAIILFNKHTRD